eukprot:gnl/MRDRNA2_/MRDRNA2_34596_c0_seq1.p1 gnl/MRDRNA2_/MRDRNA2_34596_c0~~gnl/MRDRNA2_/MRDRNA2_34596_c0_seq1.p1  ORF type:complete len:1024 (-),score=161.45 gnl/MRDRNA2_/MRDRNA2_34596_c0_seq1:255-3272(-)
MSEAAVSRRPPGSLELSRTTSLELSNGESDKNKILRRHSTHHLGFGIAERRKSSKFEKNRRSSLPALAVPRPGLISRGSRLIWHRSSSKSSKTSAPEVKVLYRRGTEDVSFSWNGKSCSGSKLHLHVLQNDIEMVRRLCEESESASTTRFTYLTDLEGISQEGSGEPIHLAASRGLIDMVKLLQEFGASLETCVTRDFKEHYRVLHAAVFAEGAQGNTEMVQYLLDNRADVWVPNSQGLTPLDLAYKTGALDVIAIVEKEALARAPDVEAAMERCWMSLEAGFRFGNLKNEDLTQLAPLKADSLMVFLRNDPRCIKHFIEKTMQQWQYERRGFTAARLAAEYQIDEQLVAELLHSCPESAASVLTACTGLPLCENPGRNPIPSRTNFREVISRDSSMSSLFCRFTNPVPKLLSFYQAEEKWEFNAMTFTCPDWQARFTHMNPPFADVEIRLCYIKGLLSARILEAIVATKEADLDLFSNHTVRALIDRAWWEGAWLQTVLAFFLNVWGLVLLTVSVNHSSALETACLFVGSRGIFELLLELFQLFGYMQIGRTTGYFRIRTLVKVLLWCPSVVLLGHYSLSLHALVVIIYWLRILDVFRCAESIAVVLIPILRTSYSIIPALWVMFVMFLALLEAFYIFAEGNMMEIFFEIFVLLFAAEYELKPSSEFLVQFMVYGGHIVFTVGLLNLFIGVICDSYKIEKEKVDLELAREKASASLDFLLCAQNMPFRGTLRSHIVICTVAFLTVIIPVIMQFQIIPWFSKSRKIVFVVFFMMMVMLYCVVLHRVDAPWPTLRKPQPRCQYVWVVKPLGLQERISRKIKYQENISSEVMGSKQMLCDIKDGMESLKERAEFLGEMLDQLTGRVKNLEQSNAAHLATEDHSETREQSNEVQLATEQLAKTQTSNFDVEVKKQLSEIHTWIKNAKVKAERKQQEKKEALSFTGSQTITSPHQQDALSFTGSHTITSPRQHDSKIDLECMQEFYEFQQWKKWKAAQELSNTAPAELW